MDAKVPPLYEQLYSAIKSKIEGHILKADEKLPSKRRLAEHLNISQNTVQTAYQQLLDEGYLYSRERSGYFAAKLDHIILPINEIKDEAAAFSVRKSEHQEFNYQGVDHESFSSRIWRKLSWDVIGENDLELTQLGHPQGYLPLRNSIRLYLEQSRGVKTSAEHIIISSGTEYLFDLILRIIAPQSVIGIEDPGFGRLKLLFEKNNTPYCPIALDSYGMSVKDVRAQDVDLLSITPSHQFPTGIIYPISRRQELLKWAGESPERYIIEDDYDSEFKYAGKPILALKATDNMDQVIYIGSFSKSISPALRISYMALPEKLLRRYHDEIPYLLCPVPTITQKVLSLFIQQGHFTKHINKMRTVYKKKRELLVQHFKTAAPNLEILGADAGLHLILNFKNSIITEAEMIEAASAAGVSVYGMSQYAIDKNNLKYRSAVLLGYGSMPEKEVIPTVKKLSEAWASA